MERFAQMLLAGVAARGIACEIWHPEIFFARRFSRTNVGLAKWLGYVDKWIYYPIALRRKIRALRQKGDFSQYRFHIADHSNAYYLKHLPLEQTAITCHDVLAIRGAQGDSDTYCPASRTGKTLQAWILKNLIQAKTLAAVSKTTLDQLESLAKDSQASTQKHFHRWEVILNGFNDHFWPMSIAQSAPLLTAIGIDPSERFLLHVGSSLPRKNRGMLVDLVTKAGLQWDGKIVFAGAAIDRQLRETIEQRGLSGRVVEVVRPSHETLVALYSRCFAFIFPSFSEGFGWPLIEAQACGAPVIASNRQPMLEVSDSSALHADADDPSGFAAALRLLNDVETRNKIIDAGYRNTRRFESKEMIRRYLALHEIG